jgi:DNA polymerase-1
MDTATLPVFNAAATAEERVLRDALQGRLTVVSKADELAAVTKAVHVSTRVGVDTETTSLDTRKARVRLLQLATLVGVYVLDVAVLGVEALRGLLDLLARRECIFHHSKYDLSVLDRLGFVPGVVHDTETLSRMLRGNHPPKGYRSAKGPDKKPLGYHTLAEVSRRELGVVLDKTEQASDWSVGLRPEQIQYAALDAAVLPVLFQRFYDEIRQTGQEDAYEIERRCLPGMAWTARSGVLVNVSAVKTLAGQAEAEMIELTRQLKEQAPVRPLNEDDLWNWNSHPQVKTVLAAQGLDLPDVKKDTIAALDHPLAKLLTRYRAACRLEDPSEANALRAQLDAAVSPKAGAGEWNWDSPIQVQQVFEMLGIHLEDTRKETLELIDKPLARLLTSLRKVAKRVSTYGYDWVDAVSNDGRMYAGWKQLGADSGRMSCAEPNLMNLPRDKAYRRCLIAPPGRVLVKADYSQIELRICAMISGDKTMLEAYDRGEDLYIRTARDVLGAAEVTKEHRQMAKPVNLGLIYGMGPPTLQAYARNSYKSEMTLEQAVVYHRKFFKNYPGVHAWQQRLRRQHARETRTLSGRRRVLAVDASDTKRFNTPIQGTGADGIKRALALLWERRHLCPGAIVVLVIHDEIVVECDADQIEAVMAWLRQAMIDGMAPLIHPVPVEVEIKVGTTWACDSPAETPSAEIVETAVVADVVVESTPKL